MIWGMCKRLFGKRSSDVNLASNDDSFPKKFKSKLFLAIARNMQEILP